MTVFIDASPVSQIGTYAGLIQAVGDWLDRSDLNTRIPDFIALAEARFRRVLVMPDMETQISVNAAASSSLPVDYDSSLLLVIVGTLRGPMQQVTLSEINNQNPNASAEPRKFATINNTLLVWPSPDQTYTAQLSYRAMLPSLSMASTNWLLSAHPDVYLYASILEAEGFLVNDERIPNIKALLDEKLDEIMRAGNRKRFGGGPLVMQTGVREGLGSGYRPGLQRW